MRPVPPRTAAPTTFVDIAIDGHPGRPSTPCRSLRTCRTGAQRLRNACAPERRYAPAVGQAPQLGQSGITGPADVLPGREDDERRLCGMTWVRPVALPLLGGKASPYSFAMRGRA